jgi:alpha-tubulin suppressor-like RCC1 family protein
MAKIFVWGDNSAKQIDGAPTGSNFEKIAPGGASQSLAIRNDGSVVLWGGVGVTTPTIPALPATLANDRYVDAYIALKHLVLIKKAGHLVVTWNSPGVPPSGLHARAVAAGAAHGVAIAMNGKLHSWGPGPGAIALPAGKFTKVSARTNYTIALDEDGTLFGWGGGGTGGNIFKGWNIKDLVHFFVKNDPFVAIAAGTNHILALRADGTVAGWGDNTSGETVAPPGIHFKQIAAGSGYSIGLDEKGVLHHWGDAKTEKGNVGDVPAGTFVSIGAAANHAAAVQAGP